MNQTVFIYEDYFEKLKEISINGENKKKINSSIYGGDLKDENNSYQSINSFIDNEKDTIFILLIGISGVGKSTFINMVVNYIKYSCLQDAIDNETLDQIYNIASKVNIKDSDKKHIISLGSVDDYRVGSSVTQYPKKYKIILPDGKIICLIDSPGVGDPKGTLQDKKHFENILHEISSLKKLNAICILMRPNETRATVLFNYCLNELLLHLHTSAKDNIFFCFTHTRGTMFKPGPTKSILEEYLKFLKEQTNIEISLEKNKIFCFDNESFNYLTAKSNGVTNFSDDDRFEYGRSWDRSSKELSRLLVEISKVKPHDVANTVCINNARTMIIEFSQPMATCISNINSNINLLDLQIKKLKTQSIKESLLYIPESVIQTEKIGKNHLICTKAGCNRKKEDVCKIDIPSKISWFSSLYWFDNFNFIGMCKLCNVSNNKSPCHFSDHCIICFKETSHIRMVPSSKKGKQKKKTNDQLKEEGEILHVEIEDRKKQLMFEYDTIKNSIVDFSVFFWNYSLVKINNFYEEYINIQIKNLLIQEDSEILVKKLKNHLKEYKLSVEECRKNIQEMKAPVKSQKEIFETFDTLLNLPMVGYIIHDQVKIKRESLTKCDSCVINIDSCKIDSSLF
ncbi:hypothetical protein RB653_000684 [Dictyostelium firmibasis]|uniref:G domain-containing protein n=1 Tax=Dictyostelium firmibasis TaxID=79012 RepID=A0AAN7U3Q5_9MYCE